MRRIQKVLSAAIAAFCVSCVCLNDVQSLSGGTAGAEEAYAENLRGVMMEIEVPDINDMYQWYYSDEYEFFRDGIKVLYTDEYGYSYDASDDAVIYFNDSPAGIYNGKPGKYEIEFCVEYDNLSCTGVLPVMIFYRGDVNFDGKLTLQDAICVRESLLPDNINKDVLTPEQIWTADMDFNAKVETLDLITILKQILDELPLDDIDISAVTDPSASIGANEKGIEIGNVNCEAGDTVEIPLSAVNVYSKGCTAVLSCDAPLDILNAGYVKKLSGDGTKIAAVWLSDPDSSPFGYITINVPENTPPGNYPINFLIYELDDNGINVEEPVAVSGSVTVERQMSAADIVSLKKYLVNSQSEISKRFDFNSDGAVNVFDLILLRRRVLMDH